MKIYDLITKLDALMREAPDGAEAVVYDEDEADLLTITDVSLDIDGTVIVTSHRN